MHLLVATFPYDEGVRSIVRDVPGRRWDEKRRIWLLPDNSDSILRLKARLEATGWRLNMTPDVRDYLNHADKSTKEAIAIREAGDSDIAFEFVTQPYAHQRAGLAFLCKLGGGALLWEMGLGKTKTAIDYAEWLAKGEWERVHPGHFVGNLVHASALRVLVICPNTVRRNWGHEIELHAGHKDYVIPDGDYKKRMPLVGSKRYTILNTEALSQAAMVGVLAFREWDLIVVDESTRFKGPKSLRTKALHTLRSKHRIILTGTPITGSPEDAWAPFEFVSPGLFGKSFYGFRDRYLELDYFKAVKGIKPGMGDELRSRIDSRSYRILKAEVLDLPPKVYVDRTVKLEGEQARAYRTMRDELRAEYEGGQIEAFNVLTQLLRLTQITAGMIGEAGTYQWLDKGNAKEAELDGLMDELGDEPVVVFGLYQEELRQLAFRYTEGWEAHRGLPLPIIYGPTPEKVRASLIDDFQAGKIRRLFVQSRTGGIGINLTAARTAIYYTRGWSLEEYLQSQDRLHRIGQTGTVTIVHLIAEGTVDMQIAAVLATKTRLADNLTGDLARKLARQALGMKEH